jgi:hypothetical protein
MQAQNTAMLSKLANEPIHAPEPPPQPQSDLLQAALQDLDARCVALQPPPLSWHSSAPQAHLPRPPAPSSACLDPVPQTATTSSAAAAPLLVPLNTNPAQALLLGSLTAGPSQAPVVEEGALRTAFDPRGLARFAAAGQGEFGPPNCGGRHQAVANWPTDRGGSHTVGGSDGIAGSLRSFLGLPQPQRIAPAACSDKGNEPHSDRVRAPVAAGSPLLHHHTPTPKLAAPSQHSNEAAATEAREMPGADSPSHSGRLVLPPIYQPGGSC